MLVSPPRRRLPIEEAIWFRQTLEEGGLPFAGVVVNRVHHDLLGDAELGDVAAVLKDELEPALATRVAENFRDYHILARRDAHNIARLESELGEVHSCWSLISTTTSTTSSGLHQMHRFLFATDGERERLIADVVA